MNSKDSNTNPNPKKPMLAFHFLRALACINKKTPMATYYQRSCIIKRAAYASMAQAAGPRRAWSRAVLRLLRRGSSRRPRLPTSRKPRVFTPRRVRVAIPKLRKPSKADVLRRLVPGAKAMDLSSLLEETSHYIQSLSALVSLMQSVVGPVCE